MSGKTREQTILETIIREAKKLDKDVTEQNYFSTPKVVVEVARRLGLDAEIHHEVCEFKYARDARKSTIKLRIEAVVVGHLVAIANDRSAYPPGFRKIKPDWAEQEKIAKPYYEKAKELGLTHTWKATMGISKSLTQQEEELIYVLFDVVKVELALAQKDVIEKSLTQHVGAANAPTKKM